MKEIIQHADSILDAANTIIEFNRRGFMLTSLAYSDDYDDFDLKFYGEEDEHTDDPLPWEQ